MTDIPHRRVRTCRHIVLGLALALDAGPASAGEEDAIRLTLMQWMAEFNAGSTERICDLFSTELRYDYRGFPERSYADICAVLNQSLSDPARRYSYAVDIREVLTSGDSAVVRLVWTLTIAPADGTPPTKIDEYGMDFFRKQADGSWKITRFLAYDAP